MKYYHLKNNYDYVTIYQQGDSSNNNSNGLYISMMKDSTGNICPYNFEEKKFYERELINIHKWSERAAGEMQ